VRIAVTLLLLAGLLGACTKASADKPGRAAHKSDGRLHKLVLVLSGSAQSQWDADVLSALGAELGLDPFATQSTEGHLDVLGPYDVALGETKARLAICLLGLDKFTGLQAQTDLGVEARQWIDKQAPEVAWLDGDRAQFFVGRELAAKTPIVFSGVVNDRQTYYGANATGVYKRPALPALLELIWQRAPHAQNFALVSDAAPLSRGSVQKFNELLTVALRGQGKVTVTDAAENWTEMRTRLVEASKNADAIIVTGIGEEQGGEAFVPPCPEGLLKDIKVPVVCVGESDAASCFPVVVRLRPSAHVKLALGMCGQLMDGADATVLPTLTPEEMQVTVNE
jgi:nucleotide-binding universal stress UspA family protein